MEGDRGFFRDLVFLEKKGGGKSSFLKKVKIFCDGGREVGIEKLDNIVKWSDLRPKVSKNDLIYDHFYRKMV